MENKSIKKDLSLWIECLTVIALAATLTFVNCQEKKDDKAALFAAAALASRGSGTVATATGTAATYTIGGTITGLSATGLVLQNNTGDDLTVASGATTFTFSTAIATGAAYAVTVKTQPTGLACTVVSSTGTATANVTNVTLACVVAITRNWGVFTDNNDGTVKLVVTAGTFGGQTYTAQTLTYMKCSHGQTWKSSTNDCTGTGTATAYGATLVQYCNPSDQSCNDAGTGLLNGTGTSSAYTACNGLNAGAGTYGKTNWRVPTKNELKLLIECNTTTTMPNDGANCGGSPSPAINTLFPNTVVSSYFSSTTYTPATSDAWYVAFTGGVVGGTTKASSAYVRCVSVP